MAQTQPAAMAKWRGRHYAARARATAASQQQQQRQQSSDAAATTTSASAKASEPATIQTKNESLARRLHSSRFHNPRFHRSNGSGSVKSSSSSSNNNNENNNENNNDNDNHQNTNNNNNNNNKPAGNASSHRPATNHRSASDRDPSTLVSMVNPKNSREMELVRGISDRLETGLNGDALSAILDLLKRGEHPESIVAVVSSLAQRPR